MENKRNLFVLMSLIPAKLFADPSDYGRPWDDPNYHSSGFSKILIPIGIIILIIFVIGWLSSNKEIVGRILKNGFYLLCGGALLFGLIILPLLDHNEKSSNDSHNTNYPPINNSPSSPSIKSNNTNQYQNKPVETYKPTLKYRTVEYLENCNKCYGKGEIICQKCNGSGWIRKTCTRCNGKGSWDSFCSSCLGKGYEDNYITGGKSECFLCHGTGKGKQNCSYCLGGGTESEICDIYASMYNQTHYQTCNNCNGYGSIKRTRQESYYD